MQKNRKLNNPESIAQSHSIVRFSHLIVFIVGGNSGECLNGIHTVDFLIWIPDYHCLLSLFLQTYCQYIGYLLFRIPKNFWPSPITKYNIRMKNTTTAQTQIQPVYKSKVKHKRENVAQNYTILTIILKISRKLKQSKIAKKCNYDKTIIIPITHWV